MKGGKELETRSTANTPEQEEKNNILQRSHSETSISNALKRVTLFPPIPKEIVLDLTDPEVKGRDTANTSGSTSIDVTRSSIMVKRGNSDYRVKAVMHGNQRACDEILMQKLYELIPGTKSPHTLFGVNFDTRPEFFKIHEKSDFQFNEENGIPNYYVASPYLEGNFEDLGKFLVDLARFVIPKQYLLARDNHGKSLPLPNKYINYHANSVYGKLREEVLSIRHNSAKDKVEKRNLLFKIYDLLPQEIKSKFDVTYYNALWIGNWDFLNFSLFNTGFIYDQEAKDDKDRFLPVIIDFGNCGPTGFGGLYKEESLIRANTPAKIKTDKSKQKYQQSSDNDPDLETTHHVTETESSFSTTKKPSSAVKLSSLPRNLPFSYLLKQQIEREFFDYDIGRHQNSQLPSSMNEALESAYSLLLIPDEAIDKVLDQWYLVGERKPIPFLELSMSDFEKIYPIAAIRDCLSFLSDQKNLSPEKCVANIPQELQARYSLSGSKELILNLINIINFNKLEVDDYFTDQNIPNSVITENLFDIAQERRVKLNEKYCAENMKQIMKDRRDDAVNHFSKKQILTWVKNNQERANFLEQDAIEKIKPYDLDGKIIRDQLNLYRKDFISGITESESREI